MRGVGWVPYGSQEAEKNKKAMSILSEKTYRQHPDTLKFTSIPDSMEMVLAKNNAQTINKVSVLYCMGATVYSIQDANAQSKHS